MGNRVVGEGGEEDAAGRHPQPMRRRRIRVIFRSRGASDLDPKGWCQALPACETAGQSKPAPSAIHTLPPPHHIPPHAPPRTRISRFFLSRRRVSAATSIAPNRLSRIRRILSRQSTVFSRRRRVCGPLFFSRALQGGVGGTCVSVGNPKLGQMPKKCQRSANPLCTPYYTL